MIVTMLFSHFSNQPDMQHSNLIESVLPLPQILWFIFLLVFAPIAEEFAFRAWVVKKKSFKYISIIGVVYYCFSATGNFIISSILLIILIIVFFHKSVKSNTFLKVMVTSIIFGLAHFGNYSGFSQYFAVVQTVGLSLIISYFALSFGFIYGILVHFANNLFVAMLILLTAHDYSIYMEKETYVADITKVSVFDFSSSQTWLVNDYIAVRGNVTAIAAEIAPFSSNIIYKANINSLDLYQYVAECKNKTDCKLDRQMLLEDYLAHANIKTDTVLVDAYVLKIIDNDKLEKHIPSSENTYPANIESLVESLRSIYKIPIVINEDISDVHILLYDELFRKKSFENIINKLETNYGISVAKENGVYAYMIYFSESY